MLSNYLYMLKLKNRSMYICTYTSTGHLKEIDFKIYYCLALFSCIVSILFFNIFMSRGNSRLLLSYNLRQFYSGKSLTSNGFLYFNHLCILETFSDHKLVQLYKERKSMTFNAWFNVCDITNKSKE